MHVSELIIVLLGVTTILAMLARRWNLPYPIVLILAGLVLGFIPGLPPLVLDPQIVFLLFLPPLLYSGAFLTNWPDFKERIRPITMLAVGLVLFTTVVTAVVAHYSLDFSWPAAFVLGAIISPPDAIAAMSILQRLRVPKMIRVVLEGESLINDASGLVAYRFGVIAVTTCAFSLGDAIWGFFTAVFGGILIGIAVAVVVVWIHRQINKAKCEDPLTITMITLLTPYAAYLPAEHLHVSGVLAAVTAGLWIGSREKELFTCTQFGFAKSVWEMLDFLLNSLIFILIGLQLQHIQKELSQYLWWELAVYSLLISLVVIGGRLIWVFPAAYLPRALSSRIRQRDPMPPLSYLMIVAWTGLRGVVSLAAAMALPLKDASGNDFKERPMILFLTFGVIFVTLVGQGLTLPWLIRRLKVATGPEVTEGDPNEAESEDSSGFRTSYTEENNDPYKVNPHS